MCKNASSAQGRAKERTGWGRRPKLRQKGSASPKVLENRNPGSGGAQLINGENSQTSFTGKPKVQSRGKRAGGRGVKPTEKIGVLIFDIVQRRIQKKKGVKSRRSAKTKENFILRRRNHRFAKKGRERISGNLKPVG